MNLKQIEDVALHLPEKGRTTLTQKPDEIEANWLIEAHLADQTGFWEADLALLWDSLKNMFCHDRSVARGEMTCRGLYVFKHDSHLGNAPAHALFERIEIKDGDGTPPRSFSDYNDLISINTSDLPNGIELLKLVG